MHDGKDTNLGKKWSLELKYGPEKTNKDGKTVSVNKKIIGMIRNRITNLKKTMWRIGCVVRNMRGTVGMIRGYLLILQQGVLYGSVNI